MRVVFDQPERIAEFVRARIPECAHWDDRYSAIGLEDGGELIAGVLYDTLSTTNICMHVAAEPGTPWLTRDFLKHVFGYPFGQLGLPRVTALTAEDNAASLKLQEALGFTREGVMREGMGNRDLIVSGMLRRECRYWGH